MENSAKVVHSIILLFFSPEPNANSDCTLYSALSNGAHHPAAKTQDQMVGTLDVKITRNMATDFGRYVLVYCFRKLLVDPITS